MRTLLALLGLIALVVVALIAFNVIHLSGTAGTLPTVQVQGGSAPSVHADLPTVDVGTTNRTVTLPTIHVNGPEGNSSTITPAH